MGGLSFDKDGYLYVGHSFLGVVLLDPTGQVVSNPFATTNLGGSAINLAFLRAANGDMTARLLAAYDQGLIGRHIVRSRSRSICPSSPSRTWRVDKPRHTTSANHGDT